jgi:alkylation response protein AidB-like acyl-CoA dehydrogenase
MDLVLNEEQKLLRESAQKLVQRHGGPRAHRALREKAPGFDLNRITAVAEAGWLSLLVPEARGGLGLGTTDVALVLEEAGRGLMTEPLSAMIASAYTLGCGSEQTLGLLGETVAGQALVLPALQDPFMEENGTDTVRAIPYRKGFQLTGRTAPVPHASSASAYLLNARSGDGYALCLIRKSAEGLQLTSRTRVDGTEHASLALAEVEVAAENTVAAGNKGTLLSAGTFDRLVLGMSAEMLGVMEQALDLAVGYMKTRQQFGRPISSFQALQHRAVNDHIEIELTRSLLYQACLAMDEGRGHRAMVSAVKARASAAVLSVSKSVVQMHGAIGFTDEYDAGLYLRRAISLAAEYGNAESHRKRFARLSAQAG